jgi:stromal membrane-associated protein
MNKPPPKAQPAQPKQTKPADSLLGLDFFGGPQAAPPARPSSTTAASTSAAPSRPDLKQSILSLYASKPAAAPQQPQHQSQGSFSGFQSPPTQSPPLAQQSAFGGLNDAFGGMSFASPTTQQPHKPSAFESLATPSQKSTAAPATTSFGGGGGFFNTTSSAPPQAQPAAPPAPARGFSSSSGFGDFYSSTSPVAVAPPPVQAQSQGNDLFDLMGGGPPAASLPAATKPAPIATTYNNSAFNLSQPAPAPKAAPQPTASQSGFGGMSNFDAWGSTEAWGDSGTTSAANKTTTANTAAPSNAFSGGWGAPSPGGFGGQAKVTSPKVSGDEDFGDWGSAPHVPAPAPSSSSAAKPAASKPFSGGDDLFSNVWE